MEKNSYFKFTGQKKYSIDVSLVLLELTFLLLNFYCKPTSFAGCLLYTSDAADECVNV